MARLVYKIPKKHIEKQEKQITKKKVAAYARVSTDSDEQATSYEAQVNFYESFIAGRSDWEMVGIYADEGISGTSTKKREQFMRMMEDARNGKIDLILTKSISRFARNTVDTLSAIRELKEKGVEVFFEKENIWSLDGKGEVLLTIMSSLAQEESRSISENVKWGIRKRFSEGKHTNVDFSSFLGYDEGYKINEEQAAIVRRIFDMYLNGYSSPSIAKKLTEEGVKTGRGKTKWHPQSIRLILRNERYKGDVLLQKGYVKDFITHKQYKNNGEITQYYVKDHHEPIIDEETFDVVQVMLAQNNQRRSSYIFSGKLICAECGEKYTRKIWHSNDEKKRKVVWQCKEKFKTKHEKSFVTPEEIEDGFVRAINQFQNRRDILLPSIKKEYGTGLGVQKLIDRQAEIEQEIETIQKKLDNLNSRGQARVIEEERLLETYSDFQEELEQLKVTIGYKRDRLRKLARIMEILGKAEPLEEFDQESFQSLIEKILSGPEGLNFIFFDGTEILIAA